MSQSQARPPPKACVVPGPSSVVDWTAGGGWGSRFWSSWSCRVAAVLVGAPTAVGLAEVRFRGATAGRLAMEVGSDRGAP